jgi:two-component system KDP operon response regulator KdpE
MAAMDRILLVDDSAVDRKILRDALAHAGYDVAEAGDGASALRALYTSRPDLVILDVLMPEMDGWTTLRRIREMTDVPVMMLTSLDSEDEAVRGLEAGADDFVSRPVSPRALIARAAALLRRTRAPAPDGASDAAYDDGTLRIDVASHAVMLDGAPVELSPTEFRLLAALAAAPGQVQPYAALLREAWGPEYTGDIDFLRVYVSRLRKKLEANADEPARILTERGFGYRLARPGEQPSAPRPVSLPAKRHPEVRYARARDGARIAFWTLGEGPWLVHLPAAPFSHIEAEWEMPEYRMWYEAFARTHTLVRFDGRGSGLSARDNIELSLEAMTADVEAVIDAAGIDSCAMLALFHAGPLAMMYAARHPERLTHLALWSTHARAADRFEESRWQAFRKMRETDWMLYTDTLGTRMWGWPQADQSKRSARLLQDSVTWETANRLLDLLEAADVTELLAKITTPTLVMNRPTVPDFDMEVTRKLAAGLPNSRLALLEGGAMVPYVGDVGVVVRTITEFFATPSR